LTTEKGIQEMWKYLWHFTRHRISNFQNWKCGTSILCTKNSALSSI